MGSERNPTVLFEAARTAHRQSRFAEAERLYRAALAIAPAHTETQEWLGALYMQTGRIGEAVAPLSAAAAAEPDNFAFQDTLAAALMRAKRPADAVAPLRRVHILRPDDLTATARLANVLGMTGRYNEAADLLEQAVARDPVLKTQCRDASRIARTEDRSRAILENCRHILARYPAYAPAHYGAACELEKLGRIEEACRAAERAAACNPTLPIYYHVLVQGGTPAQKQAARRTLEQLAACETEIPQDGRYALHFQLAKLYEGEGRFEDAFAQMKTANALKRETTAYDEARTLSRMRKIAAVFPTPLFPAPPSPILAYDAHCAPRPLFVVGMPRSGTTLVEQILASHPSVYGAGELQTLPDLEKDMFGSDFPAAGLPSPESLQTIGERYIRRIASLAPDAAYVVDKYPLNFLRLGLIRLALPQARIVHVKRDPLDTCLSCYEQMFAGPLDFTYEMGELGRYYRAYEDLMAHWRTVLPPEAMIEVAYETLVDDLEGEARRLIAFCGLEWDARCLQFHKTERAVVTASFAQVRQPIYRKAVGRARVYAPWLTSLIAALEGKPS